MWILDCEKIVDTLNRFIKRRKESNVSKITFLYFWSNSQKSSKKVLLDDI